MGFAVRVISRKRLKDFARAHADATSQLDVWYRIAKRAAWNDLTDVQQAYSDAEYVPPRYTVFNIKGGHYRLIAVINFKYQVLYVREVLTHRDYDRMKWKR